MNIDEFINGLKKLEDKFYVSNVKILENHVQFKIDERCVENMINICEIVEGYTLIRPTYKGNHYYLINVNDLDNALYQRSYGSVAVELSKLSFVRSAVVFGHSIYLKVLGGITHDFSTYLGRNINIVYYNAKEDDGYGRPYQIVLKRCEETIRQNKLMEQKRVDDVFKEIFKTDEL